MLKNKDSLVSNLITKIDSKLEFNDPNSIKLVKSKENKAIYFSRKAIPFQKNTLKMFTNKFAQFLLKEIFY